MLVGIFVVVPCVAFGYTYNLQSKFVTSASWSQMLQPGDFDATTLSRRSDPGVVRLRCDPDDGVIIVGDGILSVSSGAVRHERYPDRFDIRKLGGDGTAMIRFNGGTLNVMCARWNVRWRYASLPFVGEAFDTFSAITSADIRADAAIIGFGAGGGGASSALRLLDSKLRLVAIHKGDSTTSLSTGVLWFPDRRHHTSAMLVEARGGDQADQASLDVFIENGSDALNFWRSHLDLQQFLPGNVAYDYTTYKQKGALRGNSWQMKACTSSDNGTCGSQLERELSRLSSPIDEILEEALSIRQLFDGSFLITTTTQKIQAVCVIVATGGRGVRDAKNPSVVLATSNTGFSDDVREQLGLSKASEETFRYHLEFERNFVTGNKIKERWFATDTCVARTTNYNLCDDYSTRSQSLGTFETSVDAIDGGNQKTCPANTSGSYWQNFMKAAVPGSPFRCMPNSKLYAGMIDTKTGFKTKLYASTELPGLFASGTTGASFTGNAYFGPGATLGLGLTSGFVIAPQVVARLSAYHSSLESSDGGFGAARTSKWPTLFIVGVWFLLVGIASHLYNNVISSSIARTVHYLFMTIGVILITISFANVHKTSTMSDYSDGKTHASLGFVVFILLWVQLLMGLIAYKNNKASKHVWFSVVHRLHGYLLLCFVAYLYWSGTHSSMFAERYQWSRLDKTKESAYGYTGAVGVLSVIGLYYARERWRSSSLRENKEDRDSENKIQLL